MNSLLPPSEKRKQYELPALGLREFAGVEADQPLDPFALAQFAKLLVVDFDQVKGLSDESRQHLLGEATDEWSGGACSRPLPNGWRIVILNPAHGLHRNRATLMEEISHVFLGHQANRLAVVTSGERSSAAEEKEEKILPPSAVSPHPNPLPKGKGTGQSRGNTQIERRGTGSAPPKILARDYNKADEEAAYAVGAAALVPFAALRRAVLAGRTAEQIARRFGVSRQLVEYRIKVTHLWSDYKDASASPDQHV
jgi:hypothetical protein